MSQTDDDRADLLTEIGELLDQYRSVPLTPARPNRPNAEAHQPSAAETKAKNDNRNVEAKIDDAVKRYYAIDGQKANLDALVDARPLSAQLQRIIDEKWTAAEAEMGNPQDDQ